MRRVKAKLSSYGMAEPSTMTESTPTSNASLTHPQTATHRKDIHVISARICMRSA
jgi:hypothetical protein